MSPSSAVRRLLNTKKKKKIEYLFETDVSEYNYEEQISENESDKEEYAIENKNKYLNESLTVLVTKEGSMDTKLWEEYLNQRTKRS